MRKHHSDVMADALSREVASRVCAYIEDSITSLGFGPADKSLPVTLADKHRRSIQLLVRRILGEAAIANAQGGE